MTGDYVQLWWLFLLLAVIFAGIGVLRSKPWNRRKPKIEGPSRMQGQAQVILESVKTPDTFDAERISKDLQGFLEQPTLFHKYIRRIRNRFTKAGEVAFIEHWIEYYEAGRKLVEAKTELNRSAMTYHHLSREEEIRQKQKDVELAKLSAQESEHNLREDRARFKSRNVQDFLHEDGPGRAANDRPRPGDKTATPSEDDIKFDSARQKRRNDTRWRIHEEFGEKVTTLVELKKWKREQTAEVLRDKMLTEKEKEDLLAYIDDLYADGHGKLKKAGAENIFEDD